jgi:hypothetical protein
MACPLAGSLLRLFRPVPTFVPRTGGRIAGRRIRAANSDVPIAAIGVDFKQVDQLEKVRKGASPDEGRDE